MNRVEIENRILHELHALPLDKACEALDFVLFLRTRGEITQPLPSKTRPLGILQHRASCRIAEDFAIDDEQLLQS